MLMKHLMSQVYMPDFSVAVVAPLTFLALLLLLDSPSEPLAPHCQELALYLSGCERHVLGLSACELAHERICRSVFRAEGHDQRTTPAL